MMKKLVVIAIILTFGFVSTNLRAQKNQSRLVSFSTLKSNKPIYILDDKVISDTVANIFNKIRPDDILEIKVLGNIESSALYGSAGAYGGYVIVTKQYGTKQYQEKFSKFSKDYRSYLIAHKGDDSRICYVLPDGSILTDNSIDKQRKLYEINASDIKSITFSKESEKATGIKPAIVGINIKAKNN
ncbi:MAG: hypothetical protein V4456_03125 [Bacteroidota bacterium]